MNSSHCPPAEVVEAFHLMWDNFPEPASLVHKSREVIAINKAHEKKGMLKPGMNCATLGDPAVHKSCRANHALKAQQAAYRVIERDEKQIIGFWVPLDGYPDHFVHFSIGSSIDYQINMTDGLSPFN